MKASYKEFSAPTTKAETYINYIHSDPNNLTRKSSNMDRENEIKTPQKYTSIDETFAKIGDINNYNVSTSNDEFNYSQYYVDRQKSRYGSLINDKDTKIEKLNDAVDKKDKEIAALQEKLKKSQHEVVNTKKQEGDLGSYVNEMSKEFLDMKEAIIVALEESLEKIQKKDQCIEKLSRDYNDLEKDYFEEKKVLCELIKKFRTKRPRSQSNSRKIVNQKNVHK